MGDIDPVGGAVVIGKPGFDFLAGQRQALHQAQPAVDHGKSAAAILNVTLNDLGRHRGAPFDVKAQQRGVQVHAGGIHIVEHQVPQTRPLGQQRRESSVAQHVGNLIPVADWVETLHGKVVGVTAALAHLRGPRDQGGMQAFAHLLGLLVEDLLGRFFPGEAQAALRGNRPQADGGSRRKQQGAGISVVLFGAQVAFDGLVSQIAGGDDVRRQGAGLAAHAQALGQVDLQEAAAAAAQKAKRVEGFDHSGAFGPAAAQASSQGDYRDGPIRQRRAAEFQIAARQLAGGVEDGVRPGVFDLAAGRQTVLGQADAAGA